MRGVVLGILVLHGLAAWALLQVEGVPEALVEAAPVFVHLVEAPRPLTSLPPPPPPPQPQPPPPPRAAPPDAGPRPVLRPPAAVLSAAPAPEPAALNVPPPLPVAAAPDPPAPPTPVGRPAPASPAPAPAPPSPPPEPAAAPRQIPDSSIDYLERPAPVYPRASIRLNESGVVVVRVLIDPAGLPRRVEVARSSGHPRLDEAAVSGVQQARFKPPTENGLPISGWARIEIPFELER